jgi:UPF0755 protein
MLKKILISVLLLVIVVVGVGLLVGNNWYKNSIKPVSEQNNQKVIVHIEEGSSSSDIAQDIEAKGLIKSSLAFRLYLRKNNISHLLQAGTYMLSSSSSVSEIADIMTRGDVATKTITFIPGYRLDQVKEALSKAGFSSIDIEKALNKNYGYGILADKPANVSLEGYIYPDTYIVSVSSEASDVIDLAIANLDEKASTEIRSAWMKNGLNLHQGLTLASIIQKEVSDTEDQFIVSQIYHKRLKIGMRLEADPTFQYPSLIRGEEPYKDINSPYNTYKVHGLPPGPIANSTYRAMHASANPTKTDYLYFISAPDGTSYFSKTREEHDNNVQKYLR